MPRGHIDAIITSGLVDGWAFDEHSPFRPLRVAVVAREGDLVAEGYAHMYRHDLAAAGLALGWCAFRLTLARDVVWASHTPLQLLDADTGALIVERETTPRYDDRPYEVTDIEGIVRADPTAVETVEKLEGLENVLQAFLEQRGVETFVGVAYTYILGRRIDESSRTLYARMIRNKRITPYGMLLSLADSQEFRSKSRMLSAPNGPHFPFVPD